jgi:hypothetical protein
MPESNPAYFDILTPKKVGSEPNALSCEGESGCRPMPDAPPVITTTLPVIRSSFQPEFPCPFELRSRLRANRCGRA